MLFPNYYRKRRHMENQSNRVSRRHQSNQARSESTYQHSRRSLRATRLLLLPLLVVRRARIHAQKHGLWRVLVFLLERVGGGGCRTTDKSTNAERLRIRVHYYPGSCASGGRVRTRNT